MTDKQLKIMLELISRMVSEVANEIEPLITEGEREGVLTWVGEGEKPEVEIIPNMKNYIYLPTGPFTAVEMVKSLARDIYEMAESLGEE